MKPLVERIKRLESDIARTEAYIGRLVDQNAKKRMKLETLRSLLPFQDKTHV